MCMKVNELYLESSLVIRLETLMTTNTIMSQDSLTSAEIKAGYKLNGVGRVA
jgi:hypothetical protein